MKIIYIIPGYKHTLNTSGYQEIIDVSKRKGYDVRFINISWKYGTMSEYIKQVEKHITDTENDLILGFSFGAMIALKIAEKYKFYHVILCSLSPYFKEDLEKLPLKWKLSLGIRRWRDFSKNYSEQSIINPNDNTYTIIYGNLESEFLQKRDTKIAQKLKIKNIHILENVKHDISNSVYQDKIYSLL